MKLDELIRDPIFQLNLLLWMARDQPEAAARVQPLFHRWGYHFLMVETPVPLPPALVSAITASGLAITVNPEPEMILGHATRRDALYLEAKRESFSSESSTAKQARGHLLAAGAAFKEVVTPYERALLCYVLPEERRTLMETCLTELRQQLDAHQLGAAEATVFGLEATSAGVNFIWAGEFAAWVGSDARRALILKTEGEDTDPSPLLLVYTAEDYSGERPDYAREAVLKQLWAQLLCEIHLGEVGAELVLSVKADVLLTKTTDGIFNYLGRERQKSLCRLVTERLFQPIREHWRPSEAERDDLRVALNGSVLTVTLRDELAKRTFTDWLEDTKKVRLDFTSLPREEQTGFGF